MADGIDRKADERMEFTTSKDVTVAPTFQDSKNSPQHFLSSLGFIHLGLLLLLTLRPPPLPIFCNI
jgi:hypothetical protein